MTIEEALEIFQKELTNEDDPLAEAAVVLMVDLCEKVNSLAEKVDHLHTHNHYTDDLE